MSENQQTRVLIQLREMILQGKFSTGERLAEIPISELLKASRTPVKLALAALEQEGLVTASAAGGYIVKTFTPREILDAIEVRGTLEGMAARLVAEHGMSRQLRGELQDCLAIGEVLTNKKKMSEADYSVYIAMNERFHDAVVHASGNKALLRAIELNNRLPFASPGAMLPMQTALETGEALVRFAHRQHQSLFEAIERGHGTRAGAIADEHAQISATNLRYALEGGARLERLMPSMKLVAGTL